jgi:hypothetical protein
VEIMHIAAAGGTYPLAETKQKIKVASKLWLKSSTLFQISTQSPLVTSAGSTDHQTRGGYTRKELPADGKRDRCVGIFVFIRRPDG